MAEKRHVNYAHSCAFVHVKCIRVHACEDGTQGCVIAGARERDIMRACVFIHKKTHRNGE